MSKPTEPVRSIAAPATVAVIGAGTMGAGIAQVAAAAGHAVLLTDARAGAAEQACEKIAAALAALVAKGRLDEAGSQAIIARIRPVSGIAALSEAAIAIEAIVEDLAAKQALMKELEHHLAADAVLATNTSSISVTAIACGMQHPQRVVGMHFFNPVPLMKLVEVVSGADTDPAVASAVAGLASAWRKTPVHAASTPGFIVNRIARPYYAEALQLLQEHAAEPAQLDRAMRAAGFRMGPCELMDLIGHDVNYAVTCSVFEANYGDRRYQPSLVQKALIDGGRLGRKSGRGFYDGVSQRTADAVAASEPASLELVGDDAALGPLCALLEARQHPFARDASTDWNGLRIAGIELHITDGRPAAQLAHELRREALCVIDWPLLSTGADAIAFACGPRVTEAQRATVRTTLAAAGLQAIELRDVPGLVVARTIAMLINEAADAVWQKVCTEADADLAMTLGVNYPAGPFDWLNELGADRVTALLDHLFDAYRSERYRISPLLRKKLWK